MSKLRQIANKALLSIINDYITKYPGIRFTQALSNLRINTEEQNIKTPDDGKPNVIKDRYHEEPHNTIMRLISEGALVEDPDNLETLEVGCIVKCHLDRYGIITEFISTAPWGFEYIVTFIGGNPTFIDSTSEDFKRSQLIPMVFKK